MQNSLQDEVLQNVREKQLQKDLLVFKQAQKLKNKIIEDGRQQIDEKYKELNKLRLTESKISKSAAINKSQMVKASLKFKYCQQIFKTVQQQIQKRIERKENQYILILIQYMVQGSIRLFQPLVKVRCLSQHTKIIQSILSYAQQSFDYTMTEAAGRTYPMKLSIDYQNPLEKRDISKQTFLQKKKEDQMCIGGVILTDETGNITYKNTFDTRINILRQICLPIMRQQLWPKN